MRIDCIARVNVKPSRRVTFKRALKEEEKPYFNKAITKAFDYLGVVNRAMIIHGSSFPVREGGVEQKIGSPYEAEEFLDFIKLFGFNSVQLGPTGELNDGDNSPYVSSIFAKNPLFIDFSLLTTPEYGSLLSDFDLSQYKNPSSLVDSNSTDTDFSEAKEISNNVLSIAFKNFKNRLKEGDKEIVGLNQEFLNFQKKNSYWLDYYAVLDVIAKNNGTDYYKLWDDKDRYLIKNLKANKKDAVEYYNQLNKEYKEEIELYKFSQFLIDKQSNADNKNRGVVYISDFLVGASKFDELIFEDVFLKNYKIGAPWGGPLNTPQLWGISVLDPNKLFNKDGSLGPAGKFLQLKLSKALQNAENIRIDHAMGLVDPYIYDERTVVYEEMENEKGEKARCPVREKLKGGNISKLKIDKNNSYQKIIPNIILPFLKEKGIDISQVVWEDLGADETGVFDKVFRKQNNLPGISGLVWSRGENAPEENWSYIGCHDDKPLRMLVEEGDVLKSDSWNPDYLAGYLNPSPNRAKEREQFKEKILSNPIEAMKAKFADLFRSTKNIQISFMDFFGINRQYNTPGTNSSKNWVLRLPKNYEKNYYESLQNGEAMNIPEILSIAVQAKSDMDFAKNIKTEQQAKDEAEPILQELNKFSEILKE